jgi:hypothetical protein
MKKSHGWTEEESALYAGKIKGNSYNDPQKSNFKSKKLKGRCTQCGQ